MKTLSYLIVSAFLLGVAPGSADAGSFRRGDGPTLVWVKIKAKRGESRWQACRRVYQRDVYFVRRGKGGTMWCKILSHRLFDNAGRKRNYNLR
jgi:hypothetical protein